LVRGRDYGTWHLTTASAAQYVLDLYPKSGDDTVTRLVSSPGLRPDESHDLAALRRDGERLPLLSFEDVRIGQPAVLMIGQVDEAGGYLCTGRITTPVIACGQIQEA